MNKDKKDHSRIPEADTGNASNPTPHDHTLEPSQPNQLLNKRADTYIRESANIEDMPDPQQEEDAEKAE